jgi:hypothetical protein
MARPSPGLSWGNVRGYYGLLEQPTLEEAIGYVRTPLRIPLPDRSAKWYALSPYWAFILDSTPAANDREAAAIAYRNSGAHLPEAAAAVGPSDAGDDETFDRIERHHTAMTELSAFQAAMDMRQQELQLVTQATRKQQLDVYGPVVLVDPTVEAAHDELDQIGVAHHMPSVRSVPAQKGWPTPHEQFAAAGQPQPPQFPSYEALNGAGPFSMRGLAEPPSRDELITYAKARRVVEPTWTS